MMKKLAAMIMIVGLAGVAPADYYINFVSYWGNYKHDGVTPVLPNIGDTATVQLIYAGADGIANGSILAGGGVAGDDVLLYSATLENTGGLYEDFAAGFFGVFSGAAYLGANIYGRIFDSDVISVETQYYVGAIQSVNNRDPDATLPTLSDLYDLTPPGLGAPQVMEAIPEPASLVLMGSIGLSTLLVRRIFRFG